MPLFIMSMNWTEKGIKSIRDWPKRLKAARDYGKKCGVTIKATYLTTGDHDLVTILEADDGGNIAKFALGVGEHGNVRTKTARAWTEAELAKFISELPPPPK
jgi:uncharacterized protein with GYD domain